MPLTPRDVRYGEGFLAEAVHHPISPWDTREEEEEDWLRARCLKPMAACGEAEPCLQTADTEMLRGTRRLPRVSCMFALSSFPAHRIPNRNFGGMRGALAGARWSLGSLGHHIGNYSSGCVPKIIPTVI